MDIEKENLKTAIDDANNDVEMLSIRLREQSNHVHLIEGEFEKLKAQRDDLLAAFIALHNQAYFIGNEYSSSNMCKSNIAIINSIKAKLEAQS